MRTEAATTAASAQVEMLKKKGFLPAPEVARAIGKTMTSVYRMIEAGHVVAMRVGRSWYLDRKSVIDYLGKDATKLFPQLAAS